jgi:hypothetical protein
MAKTNVQNDTTTTITAEELIKNHGGVSKAIRALASIPEYQKTKDGQMVADMGKIAKALGKRFQHVRNVLTQPLKKS